MKLICFTVDSKALFTVLDELFSRNISTFAPLNYYL